MSIYIAVYSSVFNSILSNHIKYISFFYEKILKITWNCYLNLLRLHLYKNPCLNLIKIISFGALP